MSAKDKFTRADAPQPETEVERAIREGGELYFQVDNSRLMNTHFIKAEPEPELAYKWPSSKYRID